MSMESVGDRALRSPMRNRSTKVAVFSGPEPDISGSRASVQAAAAPCDHVEMLIWRVQAYNRQGLKSSRSTAKHILKDHHTALKLRKLQKRLKADRDDVCLSIPSLRVAL